MTECESESETESDGLEVQTECLPRGLGWPKVSQQTVQCVTLYFVNCELFLEDGSFNPSD